jgi:hypothetical protein
MSLFKEMKTIVDHSKNGHEKLKAPTQKKPAKKKAAVKSKVRGK